jgi:hypothetical protein
MLVTKRINRWTECSETAASSLFEPEGRVFSLQGSELFHGHNAFQGAGGNLGNSLIDMATLSLFLFLDPGYFSGDLLLFIDVCSPHKEDHLDLDGTRTMTASGSMNAGSPVLKDPCRNEVTSYLWTRRNFPSPIFPPPVVNPDPL